MKKLLVNVLVFAALLAISFAAGALLAMYVTPIFYP
jgi:hypothetical protein